MHLYYFKSRIILGGGVIKHHTCNANLMRNGADFSVYINTGQVRCQFEWFILSHEQYIGV